MIKRIGIIGIGYVGSLIGVIVGYALIEILGYPLQTVFQATAILFLIFAIPCFVFVKENEQDNFWSGLMVIFSFLSILIFVLLDNSLRFVLPFAAIACGFVYFSTPSIPRRINYESSFWHSQTVT